MLSNTNYSIQDYSFVSTQLNVFRYCYVSQTIQLINSGFQTLINSKNIGIFYPLLQKYNIKITKADYANDIALLANTLVQAETQLHGLGRAAAGIGLHVNADKTVYTCFNQRYDISTLNGSFLKLVDKFTFLGTSVSSTEKDVSTRLP